MKDNFKMQWSLQRHIIKDVQICKYDSINKNNKLYQDTMRHKRH